MSERNLSKIKNIPIKKGMQSGAVFATCLWLVSCGEKASEAVITEDEVSPVAEDTQEAALPEKVTFNAHIQPILSDKCYRCHGPDSKEAKPDDSPLRIDRAEFAFEKRENGEPVIKVGNPAESLLVELLKTDDQETIMPPPNSHKSMSEREIALVEKWIEQGAEYQEHWSFIPLARPDVPSPQKEDWVSNPIDAFTIEKMTEAGLSPNEPQDASRLLRRIYFDITGLPPSPEDIEAFEVAHNEDPLKAINSVLDKLFSSPGYGEQQGRLWLDAARYADTHGMHIDNYREIWPYRDWVIKAFNDNMPFDQFTIEQLAGDLLPNSTLDQKVATGFNRCLPTTGEGGSIPAEVNAMYATDRASTTFGVWQGLTVGCAECHDHKFDPVSQKEFYQITAFFRNTTMRPLDANNSKHPPNVFVPRYNDRSRLVEIAKKTDQLEKIIVSKKAQINKARQAELNAWLANKVKNGKDKQVKMQDIKGSELHLPLVNPTNNVLDGITKGQAITAEAKITTVPGIFGHALKIDGDPSIEIGDIGNFKVQPGFSYGGFVYVEDKPDGTIISRMDPTDSYRGWDLWIEGGQIGAHIVQKWPGKAIKGVVKTPLQPNKWHHVFVVYDSSKDNRKTPLTVYIDGRPVPINLEKNAALKNISTRVPLILGARSANFNPLDGVLALQDVRLISRAMSAQEVQDLVVNTLIASAHLASNNPTLRDVISNQFDVIKPPTPTPEQAQIAVLNKEVEEIKSRGSYSLVMEEKKDQEPFAHILDRGDYASKLEKVPAGVPAVISQADDEAARDRLDLARWLVNPENPLTPRVTINRYWHYIFGRGIVETTEDFGIMGARPSHPELLDWLAAEFVSSGWDLQHMLRLMITSSTYRQAATLTPEMVEADPSNIWLTRSPRFRLHGEQIRDMALAASGTLVNEVGGAPVKPYQPEGIWETVAMPQSNTRFYKRDKDGKIYRRSIYTLWKRSAPHPTMEILNAPTRETFCVRRERTNTPLAAFVTMNDVQFVEASRILATKALKESTDTSERLDFITLRLISRKLNTEEKAIATKTLEQSLEKFEKSPQEASELIAVGDSPADKTIPVAELAAWTLVSSQILNLDEALTK